METTTLPRATAPIKDKMTADAGTSMTKTTIIKANISARSFFLY